jgi:hypothetical protein
MKARDVAISLVTLGDGWSAVAAKQPDGRGVGDAWHRACEGYRMGLEAWRRLAESGRLTRFDAAIPDQVTQQLAACEARSAGAPIASGT